MDLSNYRTLGRSGLGVSPLALGTMTFGTARWGLDEAGSRAVFDAYVERGGNFVDTGRRLRGRRRRGDGRPLRGGTGPARPARAGDEVRLRHRRRPARGRERRQARPRSARRLAAPPADRSRRPLLGACVGRRHARRRAAGDDGRPGARRQGPLLGPVEHPRLVQSPSSPPWRPPAACRDRSRCNTSTRWSAGTWRTSTSPSRPSSAWAWCRGRRWPSGC